MSDDINRFGGKWTAEKLEILETYAAQFLRVFQNQPYQKLLYFDGFAGSGKIEISSEAKLIEGGARRILRLQSKRPFDIYYFVEKKKRFASELEKSLNIEFPGKQIFVTADDCNKKLIDMANFLRSKNGKGYKVLGFIDPKGMQLEWSSIEVLKGLSIDLWILNPTSGTNRLLKRDKQINDAWLKRLEKFLGLGRDKILQTFYQSQPALFDEPFILKESDSINKLNKLYQSRILKLFKYVSKPRILKDDRGHILFHFFMATNSSIGQRIANSVVHPKASLL